MKHEITTDSGSTLILDEDASLANMQDAEPKFFARPHGKRETFDVYRGQLIVRNTVQFGNAKPERRTVVYLFVEDKSINKKYTLCCSSGNAVYSIRDAEKLIDRIISEKRCAYNLDAKQETPK